MSPLSNVFATAHPHLSGFAYQPQLIMDYSQAIEYIEALALLEQKRPSLPSLKRIEAFFSHYNSPQNSFTAFHIGGTNGKGSTAAMLDSILRQGKWKVGRFIGPHLLRYNERFHISGMSITDKEFTHLVFSLKEKSEKFSALYPQLGQLSWYEFLTALAFFYFAENNVDIAVIEVGLGGRFDATNVLQKLYATAITNISLDHEHILGSNLESIAMEKAGIIKVGIPVITAAGEPALSVISKRALEMNSPLIVCDVNNKTWIENHSEILNSLEKIKDDIYHRGFYQYQNALVALNMANNANLLAHGTASGAKDQNPASHITNHKITIEKALVGLQTFYWPGRFQIIQSEHIILDGAHNPAGTKALRESLDYLFPGQRFHFIFACYSDKNGAAMLENLLKSGDRLYLTDISGKRSSFALSTLENIACQNGIKTSIHSSVSDALSTAKANRSGDEFIIACGSFTIVKTIAQKLGWHTVEDGMN